MRFKMQVLVRTGTLTVPILLVSSLEVKNLLNNQNIKTGGYEQVRLLKNKDESYQTYQPFDSKYFYMFGTTYYMNIYSVSKDIISKRTVMNKIFKLLCLR